jgi:hypothetical protein
MIQAIGVLVVVALISGLGFGAGKKYERVIWQESYFILSNQLTKLQADLNLANANAKVSAAKKEAEIVVLSKIIEVRSEYTKENIAHIYDNFLDNIDGGLQLSAEERDSGKGSRANTMPLSTTILNFRDSGDRLVRSLDRFERGVVELIKGRDQAIARNKHCREYLLGLEQNLR